MGTSITNGTFFMQSQDGEWVKAGELVEITEMELGPEQNSIAFAVKPRVVTGTFVLRRGTRARLRRKLLGFKGHPRIRELVKAARIAGIKKRGGKA